MNAHPKPSLQREPQVVISGIALVQVRPSTREEVAEARDLHLDVLLSLIAAAPFPTVQDCLPDEGAGR